MGNDPLDPSTEVLVTVEEPAWFTELLRDTRWDQQFRDYMRSAVHQIELERASRQPVISVTITPPYGVPAIPVRGRVMEVTPRLRDQLEQGIADSGELPRVHPSG